MNNHLIRVQKFLADCGIGSRRACERVISSGVVTIDGQVVTAQGIKIDPKTQVVQVRGERVIPQPAVYILLNKPPDVICTSSDEKGRRTVHDLLPDLGVRVYNVGRLDRYSEGALLLTNDGGLAAKLMHPRYHVPKLYDVWLDRKICVDDLKKLKNGIVCEGEMMKMHQISPKMSKNGRLCYEIELREGKNRQIRRMLASVECTIFRLKRVKIGPVVLGGLEAGAWRYLQNDELQLLCEATQSEHVTNP